jgi:drug/metabolite transporter superfamily protein YnfA
MGGQYATLSDHQDGRPMEKVIVLSLLFVATTMEAGGDAVVRAGLRHQATGARMILLPLGGIMLFCYGVVLNQAPFDFGRLIGAYVATFFVVGQLINLVAFGTPPDAAQRTRCRRAAPDHLWRRGHYSMGPSRLKGQGRHGGG